MRHIRTHALPAIALALAACQSEPTASHLSALPSLAAAEAARFSEWSEPVNLGPVVNAASTDNAPALSPDGLSLYFSSDRPGGLGNFDLWVSHRASHDSPWGTPVNVGLGVNSAGVESGPCLSPDGHLLFFQSNRPGGEGSNDIYVSRRDDTDNDFGWGPPVNLGPDVNTATGEFGPWFVLHGDDGPTLYFARGPSNTLTDIYAALVTRDGQTRGAARLVAELSDPAFNDGHPTLRRDGREILFFSNRPGGFGATDLWQATRRNVHDPWSPPGNLGTPPNSSSGDLLPALSLDGRTLLFSSDRPGGYGSNDLWMSTRTLPEDVEDGERAADADQAGPRFSAWSAPVNLGPVVNTPFVEQGASISKDGLSLYFHCAGCPQNAGGADIYVSQRASVDDPWGPPQRLGSNINTTSNEQAPRLSRDGHWLFFNSDRIGGFGGQDIYVSHRRDKHDDFAWELPVNLGGGINTTIDEGTPDPFEDEDGHTVLFYGTGPRGSGNVDISVSSLLPDGTYETGVPVAELNTPSVERQPSIRKDGLEIFFASDRDGPPGNLDLFVATRARTSDPWSTPVNLGPVVNSTLVDARPAISFDGTTLYFQSTRPGAAGCTSSTGPCVFDLWVTTRARLRGPD